MDKTFDIPSGLIARNAYSLASHEHLPPVLNHSVRVYFHALSEAVQIGKHDEVDHSILFVACILHDIGCTSRFDGPQRFEVEGADAAVAFLKEQKIADEIVLNDVWEAIALHTSPGIAERRGIICRLVRSGVRRDFGSLPSEAKWKDALELKFPRLDVEVALGDAVVAQALKTSSKAPAACWPGCLLRAYLADPEHKGINKEF
jgi:HD domain